MRATGRRIATLGVSLWFLAGAVLPVVRPDKGPASR
jgi:hypothetical protein